MHTSYTMTLIISLVNIYVFSVNSLANNLFILTNSQCVMKKAPALPNKGTEKKQKNYANTSRSARV